VELWNLAHPDRKIESARPPADWAPAGAAYKAMLGDEGRLLLAGRVEIDVFVEGFVEVPLGLAGGVLAQAEVDGKPARLSAVRPADKPDAAELMVLHLSGKGRHRLDLGVRMNLQRQGGWRIADGVLPSAAAASLELVVPRPKTEIRYLLAGGVGQHETEKADETLRVPLAADGRLALRWRGELTTAEADRTLSAESDAVLDVAEDGLRLRWRASLEFRRAERERFEAVVPDGWLVEGVEGENVRGWQERRGERGRSLEIELLRPAKDKEQFVVKLFQAVKGGLQQPTEFAAPLVSLPEAAMHGGRLTIRRSPLVRLRTIEVVGATRTDLPVEYAMPSPPAPLPQAGEGSHSAPLPKGEERDRVAHPLGLRPHECYTLAAVPFVLRLAAEPQKSDLSAESQTVLRFSEQQPGMESRMVFDIEGRPVHCLEAALPDGLRLDEVDAPGKFHWAVTRRDGRDVLSVYLAQGQIGRAEVLVSGKLTGQSERREMPLPLLEALGCRRQEGLIAVLADPAFDVEAAGLVNCESVLLGRLHGWLKPDQREHARLAISYNRGDYAGRLKLIARTPEVVCDSATNVRLTDRAIEETLLLDFDVRRAGIREVSFVLPRRMAEARVSLAMLRRKTVEPVGPQPDAPLRFRLELQDDVIGRFRVLVVNDRPLTLGEHQAPIPAFEIGRTNRRFVVFEEGGRDEVSVEQKELSEMEPVVPGRVEWMALKQLFGEGIARAYMASPDAQNPRLPFHVQRRPEVFTVQASIGLAEITLLVDELGAYRAAAVLQVTNSTEQYLEIELPAGAALWTAVVAGEPVKPVAVAGNTRRTQVPLVKTAAGDPYYEVVLKYAGRLPALGTLGKIDFPMLRTVNIQPELSHVRLHLPKGQLWFDFGGTMRMAASELELEQGYVQFYNKQISQIGQAIKEGDQWTKARGQNALKQIGVAVHNQGQSAQTFNPQMQAALSANAGLIAQAQQAAIAQQAPARPPATQDNRERLSNVLQGQKVDLAKNKVQTLGRNWDGDRFGLEASKPAAKPQSGKQSAAGRQTQSTTMMVTPRIVIQEEEEEKLGVDDKNIALPEMQGLIRSPQSAQPPLPSQTGEGEALQRYQRRLEEQTANMPGDTSVGGLYSPSRRQTLPGAPHPASQPLPQMSAGGWNPFAQPAAPTVQPPPMPGSSSTTEPVQSPSLSQLPGGGPRDEGRGEQGIAPPAGLASLDFNLPKHGRVYLFTTPRGEMRITARWFSLDLARRAVEIALALVAAMLVWRVAGRIGGGDFAWLARPAGSWLLVLLGLLSIAGGVLPLVGLALILAGFGLKLRRAFAV
jgi:hypothetical protein